MVSVTKKIIITGAGGPAGINFVRSIKEAPEKISIICVDANKYHLVWLDVEKKYKVPRYDAANYIDSINTIIEETEANLIHPQPDGEVKLLSENRHRLKAKTFLPNKKTIEICQDKHLSSLAWKKEGLIESEPLVIESEEDAAKASELFGYPYWIRASVGFSARGSTLIENSETAKHWIGYWKSRGIGWKFIAQKYFGGRNIAFQSLWLDGEVVVSQARERIEYLYPYLSPSGITNTPVVAVTISDKKVNEMATKAVRSIDSHATGVFCIDLREDEKRNPKPTEINAGRFFTTSYFFTAAGVNMPYYYLSLAYGEELPDLPQYNILPEGLYWIRHIDAPAVLVKENQWSYFEI